MIEKYSLITTSAASRLCISALRKREKEKLQVLLKELESLEAEDSSTLHWRRRNNGITFWAAKNGRQHGITKNEQKIYTLARLAFLRLFFSTQRSHDYNKWKMSINELLQDYNVAGLDLPKIILTNAQYEWAAAPQSQKANRLEDLRYRTSGGVRVRSKSEQYIGNLLEEFGIPYRYEPEMRIGNRIFHPDFVIMTVDGRKIILEHFGRMDLNEYVSAALDRLNAYSAYGFVLNQNVFVSFESNIKSREDFLPILYQIMAA